MTSPTDKTRLSPRAKKYSGYAGIAALFSMAALSPLSLSGADPDNPSPTPVTVTATVTALIAPDQCDPVPDGSLPQTAVDYASDGAPITTAPSTVEAAPPTDVEALTDELSDAPRAAEDNAEINGTGPFDPYLCAPAPTSTSSEETKTITATPEEVPDEIPGVPTSLRPANPNVDEYEGDGSGVSVDAPDAWDAPTENPVPRPGGGLLPANPGF